MKRVLVLNGSPREGGNTEMLAEAFCKGAQEENICEVVRLSDFRIAPCSGCEACKAGRDKLGLCVKHDDMMYFWEKLFKTDVLIIASPLYFYGVSAQTKAFIDRLHAPARGKLPIRKIGMLLVGASELPTAFDSVKLRYEQIRAFFGLEDGGVVCVGGVRGKGEVAGKPQIEQAYEMGKNI